MFEIEKVTLSLEFWGSKWILLEGPRGLATAYLQCFREVALSPKNCRAALGEGNFAAFWAPHLARGLEY